jgi:hypothetical protein
MCKSGVKTSNKKNSMLEQIGVLMIWLLRKSLMELRKRWNKLLQRSTYWSKNLTPERNFSPSGEANIYSSGTLFAFIFPLFPSSYLTIFNFPFSFLFLPFSFIFPLLLFHIFPQSTSVDILHAPSPWGANL